MNVRKHIYVLGGESKSALFVVILCTYVRRTAFIWGDTGYKLGVNDYSYVHAVFGESYILCFFVFGRTRQWVSMVKENKAFRAIRIFWLMK